MVKDSKKQAAQQVTEMSNRVKETLQAADEARLEKDALVDSERKAVQETERIRTELEIASKNHDDMQQQMAREMALMKRDQQDQRSKMKIFQVSLSISFSGILSGLPSGIPSILDHHTLIYLSAYYHHATMYSSLYIIFILSSYYLHTILNRVVIL